MNINHSPTPGQGGLVNPIGGAAEHRLPPLI
jgi:hypothetical protein